MNIGNRIKHIRNIKNISTYKLAEITGISQSVISKLENGSRRADIETIEKICNALGITLADFFNFDGERTNPEYLELIKNAKDLSPEQLKILNDIIKNF